MIVEKETGHTAEYTSNNTQHEVNGEACMESLATSDTPSSLAMRRDGEALQQ
jgi:hypothetical protein